MTSTGLGRADCPPHSQNSACNFWLLTTHSLLLTRSPTDNMNHQGTHILYIVCIIYCVLTIIPNFFWILSFSLGYSVHPWVFSNRHKSQKKKKNQYIYWKQCKEPHAVQSVLFKGQLYVNYTSAPSTDRAAQQDRAERWEGVHLGCLCIFVRAHMA